MHENSPQKNPRGPVFKNVCLLLAIIAAAMGACFFLRSIDHSDAYAPMVFILAVFLIARFTRGYLYGIFASLAGVLIVNFVFTYPYFCFNFTLSGYPITIFCLLAVSLITSAMTTRIKEQERVHFEAQQEKMRGNLLRAISHDLRTPLTSISGSSLAILENDGALSREERLSLASGIHTEAQWLIRLVENLLTITRIGSEPDKRLQKTPEAAEELVQESVTRFKLRFPAFQVDVRVPAELLLVPMDAMLIEQVLINLLENAALHARGAARAALCVRREGAYAVFSVSDDGCGIPSLLLPHLFEGRFEQKQDTDGGSQRSLGIGLTVCNTIIRAHGGTMCAENRPAGGAVFRFSLPLEEELA